MFLLSVPSSSSNRVPQARYVTGARRGVLNNNPDLSHGSMTPTTRAGAILGRLNEHCDVVCLHDLRKYIFSQNTTDTAGKTV
ncbi:hypothetical protein E2C01_014387 [Portunus trituberculatus]|uniref:Uncharacterized protein n=1 Tax=Portunus trituberculatus TaxID=210409 RepID=A0A5B7DIP2_PORTR|nr:hypothetical protein [Portunus trituberculatus]